MHVLDSAAKAAIRAQEIGLVLPAPVAEAVERMHDQEAQVASLPVPEAPPSPAELIAAGVPAARAGTEAMKLADKATAQEDAYRAVREAVQGSRFILNRRVGENREALILALRPIMERIVDSARPHAETLRPFAPGYNAEEILRRGGPEHLDAYQAAQESEKEFGHGMALWRACYQASRGDVPGFDQRWLKPIDAYFTRPELVRNPALNGTLLNRRGHPVSIEPTVLSVADEAPEVGFALKTVQEMAAAYYAANPTAKPRTRGRKTFGTRAI